MVILDNSIVFTGLPSMRDALDLTTASMAWVQDGYTLVFGGLLLLGARSGDLLGRRRMFFVGLAVFAAASFAVGAAPNAEWLVGARVVQGVGAAILAPTSLALITATWPEGEERGRAVAAYAAVAGIGASAGLVVGGLAADLVSWRAGFFINVPVAVLMLLAGLRYLPETPTRPGRFDLAGAVLATLGVGVLVHAIIEQSLAWGATGAVLLAALVVTESRAVQPIMPLRVFASVDRSTAYAVRLLYLAAMIGFFYFTTQLLQDALGWSALQAGLGFLPMTVVNFVVALRAPGIAARLGAPAAVSLGVLVTLLGMVGLALVDPGATYVVSIAVPMVLVGIGQGIAFAPLTSLGIAGAAPEDAGAASGVLNTFHQVGTTLGLAVLVSLAAGQDATIDQVRTAYAGTAVLLALALVVAAATAITHHLKEKHHADHA